MDQLMDQLMDPRRKLVVDEAIEWLNTPFHHMARIKNVGVDCVTLIAEVYERTGVVPHYEIDYYPPDWHMHRGVERYFNEMLSVAKEVKDPLPGDVALFKYGRVFSHGGIVVQWPRIVHAYWTQGKVVYGNGLQHPLLGRDVKFLSPFKDEEK